MLRMTPWIVKSVLQSLRDNVPAVGHSQLVQCIGVSACDAGIITVSDGSHSIEVYIGTSARQALTSSLDAPFENGDELLHALLLLADWSLCSTIARPDVVVSSRTIRGAATDLILHARSVLYIGGAGNHRLVDGYLPVRQDPLVASALQRCCVIALCGAAPRLASADKQRSSDGSTGVHLYCGHVRSSFMSSTFLDVIPALPPQFSQQSQAGSEGHSGALGTPAVNMRESQNPSFTYMSVDHSGAGLQHTNFPYSCQLTPMPPANSSGDTPKAARS